MCERATHRSLAGFVFLLVLASVASAGVLPKETARWLELETEGFTFISGIGEKGTRKIARELELFRQALGAQTGGVRVPSIPTRIYLFKNPSAFKSYMPLYEGKPKRVGGYFRSSKHAHFMAADSSNRPYLRRVLYHEYVHQVLRETMPFSPIWFGEGLAGFYSTFEARDEEVLIGIPNLDHLNLLAQRSMSVERMLSVNTDSKEYNHRDKQSVFYAQSWLMVHYLLLGRENGSQQIIEFLDKYRRHAPSEENFRSVFGVGYTGFNQELKNYLRRHVLNYRRLVASITTEGAREFRDMERAEVLAALGELVSGMRSDVARQHLDAALDLDAEQPQALAALADLIQNAEPERSRDLLQLAAESDSGDPSIHFRYALKLGQFDGTSEQIVSELRRSIEVGPNYGPAWAELALTLRKITPLPEDAAQVALRALQLLPERVDLALCLMDAFALQGDFVNAVIVVDRYVAVADNGRHLRRARQTLAKIELQHAAKFIEDGLSDDARALLDHIESAFGESLDFLLAKRLQKLRATLREQEP